MQADCLPAEPQGKPKNTEVGSLSLLQQIFLTQELNRDLWSCRWILYQLSNQGNTEQLLCANVSATFNVPFWCKTCNNLRQELLPSFLSFYEPVYVKEMSQGHWVSDWDLNVFHLIKMDNSVLEKKPIFFPLQQDINRCHTWAGSTNWSKPCVRDERNKWEYNKSKFNLTCIDWVDKWLAYTGLLFWI